VTYLYAIVTSFQAVMQKCDKIYELPKIPKGLVCFVGKNGVMTCVLYMPVVIDSEDLTVMIFTGFPISPPPSIFRLLHQFLFICSGMLVCILSCISKSPIVALPQCECDPGKETCRMSYMCLKTEKAVKFQLESELKSWIKFPKCNFKLYLMEKYW